MTELPLVSIITPSFNQSRFLEAAINSVLSQDYPRIEYMIVDGGSSDGSVDIIKKYEPKLGWWVSEKDAGQTDAINKGFSRAEGQIFAWLNSDDTYEPSAVSRAVGFLLEHPSVGMVYGDANYINEQGNILGKFPAAQTDDRLLRQGYVHIPQQAAFFKGDLWRTVGPLDRTFFFAMDYDLWRRLAKLTTIHYWKGQVLANFRIHPGGKSFIADDRCWPEMLRVHYREGGSLFSVIVIKYYLRKVLAPFWNWYKWRRINM